MILVNAIKKLSQYGEVIQSETRSRMYHIIIKSENDVNVVLSFCEQDEDIICIHTKRDGEESDSMSDYFPGCFHRNLTQAIRFALTY